jgi:DNA mismatch repair ATPase MutL
LKNEQSALHYRGREKLAWAMASSSSIRYGQMLTLPEMKDLLQRLMACKQPQFVQGNKPVYVRITLDQIGQQFK